MNVLNRSKFLLSQTVRNGLHREATRNFFSASGPGFNPKSRKFLLLNIKRSLGMGAGTAFAWTGWIWKTEPYDEKLFLAPPVSATTAALQGILVDINNPHRFHADMELFCMEVQGKVVKALEDLENDRPDRDPLAPKKLFKVERWTRPEGGGGITCVLTDGDVFEKAGVNISVVHGILPPQAVAQMRSRGKDFKDPNQSMPFFAAGVSCVVHPRNPHVPTIHFNYRYFEVEEFDPETREKSKVWWFGGGTDLTPYVLHEKDVVHFHTTLKDHCKRHGRMHYPRFKKWCDTYFRIPHRDEARGVGGIFFDDLDYPSFTGAWKFVKDMAGSVLPSYVPIVERNMARPYTQEDRDWQLEIGRAHV